MCCASAGQESLLILCCRSPPPLPQTQQPKVHVPRLLLNREAVGHQFFAWDMDSNHRWGDQAGLRGP